LNLLAHIKKFRPSPVTLILLGAIAYMWFRPPAQVTDDNRPLSSVTVSQLNGQTIDLQSLRGKVVLINYWATWCPYCRHEMPAMEKFYADYKGRGFEILAVSIDDNPAKVVEFMREEGYHFPAAMSNPALDDVIGKVSTVPTSFLIDKQGRVRKKISGQVHYARLEELVTPLLKE